jgi:hypothetical protein
MTVVFPTYSSYEEKYDVIRGNMCDNEIVFVEIFGKTIDDEGTWHIYNTKMLRFRDRSDNSIPQRVELEGYERSHNYFEDAKRVRTRLTSLYEESGNGSGYTCAVYLDRN